MNNIMRLYTFRYLVGKNHVEFKSTKQQDAAEYLLHLLQIFKKFESQENIKFLQLFEFESKT